VSSLPQAPQAIQAVLEDIPEEVARATGFCRRRSKLTGAGFVQALVFGWWQHPAATLEQLCQTAAALGTAITPQGLDQRFGPGGAALLRDRLEVAAAQAVAADPVATAVLGRFAAVELLDSTTVGLPDVSATVWRGCGGRTATGARAALKVTVRLDLLTGRLTGPELNAGRTQDRATALQHAPVAPGGLRVTDQGFTTLGVLAALAAGGACFLSRLPTQWGVLGADGQRLDVARWLRRQAADAAEAAVALGVAARVPARLLALRVPPAVAAERRRKLRAAAKREGTAPSAAGLARAGWTLLVTNVPADRLAAAEARTLLRARWQIERLFKLWKQGGRVDEWRSADPARILCEVYAKLLALVAQHWALLVGCWGCPAPSLAKAAATLRAWALPLALVLAEADRLGALLAALQRVLAAGCKLNTRRQHPATFQLRADPARAWA
jgi:hypothetical protein